MRRSQPFLLLAALGLAVALGACARKGPLEPPGAAEVPPPAPTLFETRTPPPPVEPDPPAGDFVLDPLI